MSHDLAEVEQLAVALFKSLDGSQRCRVLRSMACDLQKSQRDRVRREPIRGGFAVRFLYPKGAAARSIDEKLVARRPVADRVRSGGVRSFFWDKVDRWLPVEPEDRTAGSGRLRRNAHIRQRAMFQKLASGRNLRAGASDKEAWVGFAGRASAIAAIHQRGLLDRPVPKARAIRYPQRDLLGATDTDRQRLLDPLLRHVGDAATV